MNTTPLQPLDSRWPHDKILSPTKTKAQLSQLIGALSTAWDGRSVYDDYFQLDEVDSAIIANFASGNNMAYSAKASSSVTKIGDHYPAWCGFRIPTTAPIAAHEVKGKLFGYETTFHIEYLPSSRQDDKSNELRLTTRGVVRVTLPKAFPQIVLESNKNDKTYISTMPTAIEKNQKLALEGNFASYFDLFAPIGLQNEALTLLAPNFMQILMDSSGTFDVEFYGNEMILTTRDPLYTNVTMASVVSILEIELEYIQRLLNSWNYQPRQQPFDRLVYSYINGEVVKVGPLRLYPKQLLILILLGFVLLSALMMFL